MREILGGEYLTREYEDLRQQYEDLRQQYEDLRRYFSVSADVPYTDVWDFPTVKAYPGKHECEKPQELLRHIIKASSREGAVVLDTFCGGGSTGEAAITLGRSFIGCDMSEHWSDYTRKRLERVTSEKEQGNVVQQARLF
jgi:site-specific DNA-methyltransferase (adenine-specific)